MGLDGLRIISIALSQSHTLCVVRPDDMADIIDPATITAPPLPPSAQTVDATAAAPSVSGPVPDRLMTTGAGEGC